MTDDKGKHTFRYHALDKKTSDFRLAALLLITLCVLVYAIAVVQSPTTIAVGDPAPDFLAISLLGDSHPVQLSQYKGQAIILTFWTADCLNCKPVLRELDSIQRKFGNAGLSVVAVSIDGSSKRAVDAARKIAVSYPLFHDSEHAVKLAYSVYGVPSTFLIDRSQTIRRRIVGVPFSDEPIISESLIAKLLAN